MFAPKQPNIANRIGKGERIGHSAGQRGAVGRYNEGPGPQNRSDTMTLTDQLGQQDDSTGSVTRLPLIIGLAVLVATAGGYACYWPISYFGELGSVSLWLLGATAGFLGRKIVAGPSRMTGWLLVACCAVAFVIAETCWIRWETKQGAEGWWESIALLPTFVRLYRRAALIGTVFTFLGSLSAYRQTTR
jgi:hypothetical protein